MYLTILHHGDISRVKTYDIQGDHYKNFTSEEWEEFMYVSLNVRDCEWIVHPYAPERITVIDTNEDSDE